MGEVGAAPRAKRPESGVELRPVGRVEVPHDPVEEVRAPRRLPQGREDPAGNRYFWNTSTFHLGETDADTDIAALREGYVTVTPDLRFEVSGRIREEFENGRHYYALHGDELVVPAERDRRPSREALLWHNDNRFVA